ncbi:MAG: amino acid ABC transporter ATP-binding protein, partial [Mesorhizobium sp.]
MSWFDTFSRSFLDFQAMADVLPNMVMVGLKNTLILAVASTFFGTLIGIVLAVMGISENRPLKLLARVYT